jgi:hypothetical protein
MLIQNNTKLLKMIDTVANIAPLTPIAVPIMKPYLLPTRFIKSDAGRPDSMVPSK